MNKEIFELAAINAIATFPETDNSTLKEFIATLFTETHSSEQIDELIKQLTYLNLFETIANPNSEASKGLQSFINLIRQKAHEKK
jgi:outer membrane protein assembly factor BamA